ncbi:phosphoribosylglycinamide formyltransferase [Sphingomicrobium sp. XHP0239]|uniref:phosphoribosylglycinamide formyltransferase n=1 Tax=Sphingomicrobium maritimum TaxID=3133972 RepID=UPI0031CCCD43
MKAERVRLAVLVSGRGSNMAALLYAAKDDDCPFEIALVAGNKPKAAGFDLAEAEHIPTARLDGKDPTFWDQLDQTLERHGADAIACAGFMRIIPDDFLDRWKGRIYNIHPSLLPAYKGTDVHQRVLAAGDTVSGASVHHVTSELDAGEVLGAIEVAVLPDDTPDTLAARVLLAEHQLYPRVLRDHFARFSDAAWIERQIEARALSLPETTAKTSHGAPAWRVGPKSSGKFFAILWNRHHGEDHVAVLVKTSGQDEMAALIDADPDLYFRPAYYGPSDWIGLRVDSPRTDWDHVDHWLRKSWSICAPARLTKLQRAADAF